MRFGCKLHELTQHVSGVHAVVADAQTQTTEHVYAWCLIAADGAHSTVRQLLGIRMLGPDDLPDYERVEFSAPL